MATPHYEDYSSGWADPKRAYMPGPAIQPYSKPVTLSTPTPKPSNVVTDPADSNRFIDLSAVSPATKIETIKLLRELVQGATIKEALGDEWGLPREDGAVDYQEVSNPKLFLGEAKALSERLFNMGYRIVKVGPTS